MKIDQVDSSSQLRIIGGKRTWEGSTVPASPQDGDEWFEQTSTFDTYALFPQPWVYNAAQTQWFSQYVLVPFTNIRILSTNANLIICPLYFYNQPSSNKIYIGRIQGILDVGLSGGVAHTTTDYHTFALRAFKGDGTNVAIFTPFPENTQNQNPADITRYRRITQNFSNFLPGNTWFLYLTNTKVGSASNINVEISLQCFCRFGRP